MGGAFAVDAVDPRNSGDARFDGDFEGIAHAKAIEVVGFDGQSFEFSSRPPGTDDQSPAASYDSLHIKGGAHGGGNVFNIFWSVEFSVHEKNDGENPRQRNKAVEDSLYGFNFGVAPGEAVENYGQRQRDKKQDAKKYEHQVQIKRRKDLADVGKAEGAGKKNQRFVNEPPAEDQFGRGGGQPARGALI